MRRGYPVTLSVTLGRRRPGRLGEKPVAGEREISANIVHLRDAAVRGEGLRCERWETKEGG